MYQFSISSFSHTPSELRGLLAIAIIVFYLVSSFFLSLDTLISLEAAISFLQSLYSANHQDRLWGGRCDAPLPANITHVWTTFANVFKGNMSFVCPFGGVVTGELQFL